MSIKIFTKTKHCHKVKYQFLVTRSLRMIGNNISIAHAHIQKTILRPSRVFSEKNYGEYLHYFSVDTRCSITLLVTFPLNTLLNSREQKRSLPNRVLSNCSFFTFERHIFARATNNSVEYCSLTHLGQTMNIVRA